MSNPVSAAAFSTNHNNISHAKLMDHIEDRLYKYRAKRIRFLINGDKLFSGINYALNTERIRSFDALLNDLTRSLSLDHLKLCKGVRYIFSTDGALVQRLTDFQDGHSYICSSTDSFVSIEYRVQNGMPNWLVRNSACISSDERAIRAKLHRSACTPSPKSRTKLENKRQPSPAPRNRTTNAGASHYKDTNRVSHVNGLNHNHGEAHRNSIAGTPSDDQSNQLDKVTNGRTQRTPVARLSAELRRKPNNHIKETSHDNHVSSATRSPNLRTNRRLTNHNSSNSQSGQTTPIKAQALANSGNHGTPVQASNRQQTPKKSLSAAQVPQQSNDSEASLFGSEVLKKYDVGRPIGDGHFSVVYCCMNKSTQEFCALKLIDKLKCKGKDDMIYNEVKILKRLSHPNIVKLIEEFDYPKQLYLILELVQDGDLFDAISNVTKFSEVHVATMIHNLSSALTYLHKQGIVHRDIKPENLLISVQEDGSQSVKLADFGLAVELGDDPLYSVCGTAFYVSPEMLNETGYDFKVDVWATGVICFILLCGYPPFTSENESSQDELFDAILAGDFHFAPPYWNTISQHAKNLIKCMLTVDPERRYTAEQVFNNPWTMGTSSNFEGINPMNISRKVALFRHGEV